MTELEALQVVKKHLLCQKVRSVTEYGCAYRGAEGRKCAVGALIPDDEYREFFDHEVILWDVMHSCPSLSGLSYEFLTDLQALHDREEPENWESLLNKMERELSS